MYLVKKGPKLATLSFGHGHTGSTARLGDTVHTVPESLCSEPLGVGREGGGFFGFTKSSSRNAFFISSVPTLPFIFVPILLEVALFPFIFTRRLEWAPPLPRSFVFFCPSLLVLVVVLFCASADSAVVNHAPLFTPSEFMASPPLPILLFCCCCLLLSSPFRRQKSAARN